MHLQVEAGEVRGGWCFSYGEQNWLAGNMYDETRDQTERHVLGRQRSGDINARVNCS